MNTRDLFEALSNLAGQAKIDPSLEATVFVELEGTDPAQWGGIIKDGQITLMEGKPENPDLTIGAASETALGLFQKTMDPMMAFMTGKIKVSGDIGKVALLKQLLAKKK